MLDVAEWKAEAEAEAEAEGEAEGKAEAETSKNEWSVNSIVRQGLSQRKEEEIKEKKEMMIIQSSIAEPISSGYRYQRVISTTLLESSFQRFYCNKVETKLRQSWDIVSDYG